MMGYTPRDTIRGQGLYGRIPNSGPFGVDVNPSVRDILRVSGLTAGFTLTHKGLRCDRRRNRLVDEARADLAITTRQWLPPGHPVAQGVRGYRDPMTCARGHRMLTKQASATMAAKAVAFAWKSSAVAHAAWT